MSRPRPGDSSPQGTVTRLITRLKAGESSAAQHLWELYFLRMVGMAREKLRGASRRVVDEEDIALSAFNSFCQGAEKGRFTQLMDRTNLWPLLVAITAHKAVDQIRHQRRQKRGGQGVTPDRTAQPVTAEPETFEFEAIISREPAPEFAAQVAEEFERLLNHLPDDALRSVALWKMEGLTTEEIAERLQCVPRTVERKLQLIRTLWQRAGVSPDSRPD